MNKKLNIKREDNKICRGINLLAYSSARPPWIYVYIIIKNYLCLVRSSPI